MTAARLLQEKASVHVHIAHVHNACVSAFEKYTGINLVRWRVLFMLHTAGESTQKELVELTGLDGWSITRAVQPLEAEGYLERRIDPSDNRLTRVRLSAKGRGFYTRLKQRGDAFLAQALIGIDENEVALLTQLLARIRTNLENAEPDPVSARRAAPPPK